LHVVILAVLILHGVVDVPAALESKLVTQLWSSIPPLHHRLHLVGLHDTTILGPDSFKGGLDVVVPDPSAAIFDEDCAEAELQGMERS